MSQIVLVMMNEFFSGKFWGNQEQKTAQKHSQ